jgi:prepilin-type N-terminal cleavage/methylation domain-containing protein
MNRSKSGFTLIELMIVVAIIAIIAAIAIPSILRSRISANQTSAVASLDTVFKMNTQFRSNDSDNNGENDYWAQNVFGLYGIESAGGDRIELFSKSLALSDYEGVGEISDINSAASSFTIDDTGFSAAGDETPKSGYYVSMFTGQTSDTSDNACDSDESFTTAGDISGGSVGGASSGDQFRNDNRFAVSAFPSLYNNTGTKAYAIDQGGDKFEIDAKSGSGVENPFNGGTSGPSGEDTVNSSPGTAPNECLPAEDVLNSDWGTVG